MFDAQGVCAMRITYDQIVLNGDTPAVQKINQQLNKDRENFLRPLSEDLKQNILSNAVYNPNSYHNTADAAVAYQSAFYLSICVTTDWYGGGVRTIDHYGLNFDLTMSTAFRLSSGISEIKLSSSPETCGMSRNANPLAERESSDQSLSYYWIIEVFN